MSVNPAGLLPNILKEPSTYKPMKIIQIAPENIETIQPLWEGLRRLHEERSTHFNEHFKSFTFEKRMAQIKTRDTIAVFAAKNDHTLIGYCIASVGAHIGNGQTGEIDSIFIDPQYRKSGIGDQLITHAENWLKANEITKIHICVARGNESVFEFYNRHGYQHRYSVLEKTIEHS